MVAISMISLYTVLAIFVSGSCLSGCRRSVANDDAKFTSSTSETVSNPTLEWVAPTTYTDGSALLDLKEYRVYYSTSPGAYSAGKYLPVSVSTTCIKVKDIISLGTGTYYFSVTAMDSMNSESVPSNEVCRYLY
jgi:hypothetical protein